MPEHSISVHGRANWGIGRADVSCSAHCEGDVHCDTFYTTGSAKRPKSSPDRVKVMFEQFAGVTVERVVAAPDSAPPDDAHMGALTKPGVVVTVPQDFDPKKHGFTGLREAWLVYWRFKK